MPGESHPPLLTRALLTNNISQMEKGLCWGKMKKIEGLCHSECTKRQAEKREGKNGTLIVNRGLKTEIIVNRRFGCTCDVFFKIHSRDVCEVVCEHGCLHTHGDEHAYCFTWPSLRCLEYLHKSGCPVKLSCKPTVSVNMIDFS